MPKAYVVWRNLQSSLHARLLRVASRCLALPYLALLYLAYGRDTSYRAGSRGHPSGWPPLNFQSPCASHQSSHQQPTLQARPRLPLCDKGVHGFVRHTAKRKVLSNGNLGQGPSLTSRVSTDHERRETTNGKYISPSSNEIVTSPVHL